jgi:hypothetical protein
MKVAKQSQCAERPLWVGSSLSDNHGFVNLSVGHRPEADIRQAQKTRHEAGFH